MVPLIWQEMEDSLAIRGCFEDLRKSVKEAWGEVVSNSHELFEHCLKNEEMLEAKLLQKRTC